jgi:signal peptidase I
MRRVAYTAPTAALAVALLLGAWLLLAPAQLGGATRYAVVEGASMEPGLSRGDLVLVRAGQTPRVGDVVLYGDPALGVRVLHRVIRVDGDRLVLKGDANEWVDDTQPRSAEVVGAYWFSVPRVGAALSWMQTPMHAALLAFILSLVALSGGVVVRPGSTEELNSG